MGLISVYSGICWSVWWYRGFSICITTLVEGLGTAMLSECLESCNFQGQTFCIDGYVNLVIASCTTSKTTVATHSSTSGYVKCVPSFPNKCNRVISLGQLRDFSCLVWLISRTFSWRWFQLLVVCWSFLLKMQIRGLVSLFVPIFPIVSWLGWCLVYLSPYLNWCFRVFQCCLYSNIFFLFFCFWFSFFFFLAVEGHGGEGGEGGCS